MTPRESAIARDARIIELTRIFYEAQDLKFACQKSGNVFGENLAIRKMRECDAEYHTRALYVGAAYPEPEYDGE